MKKTLYIWLLSLLLSALACLGAECEEAPPAPESPKIISAFVLEPEPELPPEMMVFDIYLADVFQGSVLVEYTENWFEIQEVEDAIEQFENLKNTDKVRELITGRIYQMRTIDGTGSIEYDLATFRIIVQLTADFFSARELTLTDRIPDPENNLSFLQRFRFATSGESSEDYNSAANHQTNLSMGKFWANYDGTYVERADYEVNEASINGILGRYKVDAGLLRTQGQFFTSSSDYLGLGISSTEEVYLDQEMMRGSPIEVFVPSRARVEFYKGSRLLMVRDLSFGLQQIDTTPFPQGSYDLDIIIREDNGRVTKERRFFTKSGMLTVRDRPVYFLQGGVLRDELSLYDTPVFQLGTTWRAADILQLSGSVYGDDKTTIGSAEFLTVYRIHVLKGGYLSSNEGDSAITGGYYGVWGPLGWNVNATEVLQGFDEYQSEKRDPIEDIESIGLEDEENPFEVFSNTRSQLSAVVSLYLNPISLKLNANRNESITSKGEIQERYAYGPQFEWNVIQGSRTNLKLQLSYYDTNDGKDLGAYLYYSYRFGAYTASAGALQRSLDGNTEESLNADLLYDDKTYSEKGTRANISAELKRIDGENGASNQGITRAQIEHKNNNLEVDSFLRDLRSTDDSSTAVGITGDTVLAFNHQGSPVITSPPRERAMLLVEIESRTAINNKVEVIINDQVAETVEAGSRVAIGLAPYRVYKIGIRPSEKGDLVSYDTTIYNVTVFPGNIVSKSWWMDKVHIALGRLVDEDGQPLSYQRIKGTSDYTITEEDGSFQAEITGNEKLYVKSSTHKCTVELPKPEKEVEFFQDVGDVVCR